MPWRAPVDSAGSLASVACMSLSWWWLGAVAVFVAVLSGAHWAVIDFLLDRLGPRRPDSDAAAMPPG